MRRWSCIFLCAACSSSHFPSNDALPGGDLGADLAGALPGDLAGAPPGDLAGAPPGDLAGAGDLALPEPNFDQLPWQTGANIGNGVAMKDSGNRRGNNVFIGYAGYNINMQSAQAWVTALYDAKLRDLGARWVYAVQGPADASYTGLEIGNSKIAAALQTEVDAQTRFILVAGHSSGAYVADELLQQLGSGKDPGNVTAGRLVYFCLDGDQKNVSDTSLHRLRKAYYVGANDNGTLSPNHAIMQQLGTTYASLGGAFDYDAASSGCNAGATWCVHVTLITTIPHNPANADPAHDYLDFAGRPVNHFYIDLKATEAGLAP